MGVGRPVGTDPRVVDAVEECLRGEDPPRTGVVVAAAGSARSAPRAAVAARSNLVASAKVRELRAMIDARGLSTQIELDGRISRENLETFGRGAAQLFVAGSTCLDRSDLTASAARLVERTKQLEGERHG